MRAVSEFITHYLINSVKSKVRYTNEYTSFTDINMK
jgi:hypothetical protein